MTQFSFKEIPVQILDPPPGATLVLRLPTEEFTDERAAYWSQIMREVLRRDDIGLVVLPQNIDLTVVQK